MAGDFEAIIVTVKERTAQAHAAGTGPLGHRIKFDVLGEGVFILDGLDVPAQVLVEDGEADATLTLSLETLEQLLSRQINPVFAYMSGKLKVAGNQQAALRLVSLFED